MKLNNESAIKLMQEFDLNIINTIRGSAWEQVGYFKSYATNLLQKISEQEMYIAYLGRCYDYAREQYVNVKAAALKENHLYRECCKKKEEIKKLKQEIKKLKEYNDFLDSLVQSYGEPDKNEFDLEQHKHCLMCEKCEGTCCE